MSCSVHWLFHSDESKNKKFKQTSGEKTFWAKGGLFTIIIQVATAIWFGKQGWAVLPPTESCLPPPLLKSTNHLLMSSHLKPQEQPAARYHCDTQRHIYWCLKLAFFLVSGVGKLNMQLSKPYIPCTVYHIYSAYHGYQHHWLKSSIYQHAAMWLWAVWVLSLLRKSRNMGIFFFPATSPQSQQLASLQSMAGVAHQSVLCIDSRFFYYFS